tara:strand:+ start:9831 stop:14033 length:4203 start_codon:yes stop_codon:yes gene_type:complete
MKNIFVFLFFITFLIPSNPVSDQGLDQVVKAGDVVVVSGANSYALNGSTIVSYLWTVPDEILDENPDIVLNGETLTFTVPSVRNITEYKIELQVEDSNGLMSDVYDADDLIISEYCETSNSLGNSSRYIEIFNPTGSTITLEDWQKYEVWLPKDGEDFTTPGDDFWGKLFFHRAPTDEDATNGIDVEDITTVFPDSLKSFESLVIVKKIDEADTDITEHNAIEWELFSKVGGDEPIAIVKKDGYSHQVIDVLGDGNDPGTAWNVAGVNNASRDHVLLRKSTVVSGNYPDWDTSMGSNATDSEWIVLDDGEFSYAGSHICTACDNFVNIAVSPVPVANAGEDFSSCAETISLMGSGASDDVSYTYSWTSVGLNTISLLNENTSSPSFVSPTNLNSDTEYCFELVVNNGYLSSDADQVCVQVEQNLCPVANAGLDKRYVYNTITSVSFSGSGSYDPNDENEVLSYEWSIPNELAYINQGIDLYQESLVLNIDETLFVSNPTEFSIDLTVVDSGSKASTSDTVKLVLADFKAPDSPNLYAVSYSDYVKLSWDFLSESSLDPVTLYSDFEGYKLYRSDDGGQTWCEPEDQIYNFDGVAVGCIPLIQFDLTQSQDEDHCTYSNSYINCIGGKRGEDVSGYDDTDPWVYLGNNSGLEHIYVDEDVIDGIEYTYTLTAYDSGLKTYSLDYVFSESSESVGEPYDDFGPDGCLDSYEDGLGGCLSIENPNAADPNDDNFGTCSQALCSESNGLYDQGEVWTDLNLNQVWDGDPIYNQETNWSVSNPDHWTSLGQDNLSDESSGVASMESPLGQAGDGNFVSVVPGGLPSNVSDPDETNDGFFGASNDNIGNGNRYWDIVDKSLIKDTYLAFEIQAEYGLNEFGNVVNSFEGNKCESPTLYIWEIDEAFQPIDSYVVPISSLDASKTLQSELDFPGVFENDQNQLVYPNYLVEAMPIMFSDELGAEENWTDLIYGVRFKFDNGYLEYSSSQDLQGNHVPAFRDTYTVEQNADSTLFTSLFVSDERSSSIRYFSESIFYMRPPYKYMVEFSDIPEYPVYEVDSPSTPYSGDSCPEGETTLLPFKIYNVSKNEEVLLEHLDNGLNDGFSENDEGNLVVDQYADGRKDCAWTRSERVLMKERVSTYYTAQDHIMSSNYPGEDNYSYIGIFDYFMFREYGTDDWESNTQYNLGDQVLYQSMIWEAGNIIPNFIPPPSGSDENGKKGWFDCGDDLKCNQSESGYDPFTNPDPEGDDYDSVLNPQGTENDGANDNPWKQAYPWKKGDKFYFTPVAWYADGDKWVVDLGKVGEKSTVSQDNVDDVYVVPNPYRSGSDFGVEGKGILYFRGLPDNCVVNIYTVTGKLVDTFTHSDTDSGQHVWDLKNIKRSKVAPGLYIYHVKSGSYESTGKFSIIR